MDLRTGARRRRPGVAVVMAAAAVLIAMVPAGPSAAGGSDASVTMNDGDFDMVPGDIGFLQIEGAAGLAGVAWGVERNDVLVVDRETGRVDAVGSGSATVTATGTAPDGRRRTASAVVTVSAGGDDPIVEPVPGLREGRRPDFMLGADISSMAQILAEGKPYYDLEGRQAHPLDILAQQGVNWVRLRVWNDPADAFGNPYGGGNASIETTIELARQAKQRGMKVNVVFHYSDFWAHPGQQRRPKAWANLTGQPLVDAVGTFTAESLTRMRDAGVYPDMVTIGNETNSNIVDVNFNLTAAGAMNPAAIAVFKAGSAAVRVTDPNAGNPDERTLVSFHLANGDNATLYNRFTLAMHLNGVDYDALGASFYPSWHGTPAQVLANLNTITGTYGKYAYIAETAYPWSLEESAGDDTPQNFKHGDVSTVGLAASPQGQATALRDVIDVAAGIQDEKGLGVFYWEPAWLPGPTTGWATPYGTGWETAGLFDVNGYALPSVRTFSLVRGDQETPSHADEWAYGWETEVVVAQGSALTMPATVIAVRNDGRMATTPRTIERQPVTWDAEDVAAVDVATPGEYVVLGSVGGGIDNAFAHVVVRAPGAAAAAPVFDLPDGSVLAASGDGYSYSARHVQPDAGGIELSAETANAGIFFTVDGSDPRTGSGATLDLAGAPWIKNSDPIRVYAGPIHLAQNAEVKAVARRMGYAYAPGNWGSDVTIMDNSPVVTRRYQADYDYRAHELRNGGFEAGLDGWTVSGAAAQAEVQAPDDWVTGAYAGADAFAFTLAAGQQLGLSQDSILPNGVYDLTVRVRGDVQSDNATQLSLAAIAGGEEHVSEVRTVTPPGGRMFWREFSVRDVAVTDNALTVRFSGLTTGSYSGRLDHVVLEAQERRTPYDSLRALTEELLVANGVTPGRVRSFVAVLDAARAAEERGADAAWHRQLATFEMKVETTSGKLLTVTEADELLRRLDAYRG